VNDELWVHLPFSLYHGWTTVLIVISIFQAFGVDAVHEKAGAWTKVFVFLALLVQPQASFGNCSNTLHRFFLEGTAATYAFSSPEGDLPASIAIAWALWGIFAQQRSSGFVHITSLIFAIFALFWVIKAAYGLVRRGRSGGIALDEERGPLLGSSS
jgi:hypothetical protein